MTIDIQWEAIKQTDQCRCKKTQYTNENKTQKQTSIRKINRLLRSSDIRKLRQQHTVPDDYYNPFPYSDRNAGQRESNTRENAYNRIDMTMNNCRIVDDFHHNQYRVLTSGREDNARGSSNDSEQL